MQQARLYSLPRRFKTCQIPREVTRVDASAAGRSAGTGPSCRPRRRERRSDIGRSLPSCRSTRWPSASWIERRGSDPDYLWGVLHGAYLARALGIKAVSVLECGVAGGNGLIALERSAAIEVERLFGVRIQPLGFDTGTGLPKPTDVRDCPNLFSPGDYPMDPDKLRGRLRRAELVLGDVADTIPAFVERAADPVAFVALDLDLYTSTRHALRCSRPPRAPPPASSCVRRRHHRLHLLGVQRREARDRGVQRGVSEPEDRPDLCPGALRSRTVRAEPLGSRSPCSRTSSTIHATAIQTA